MDSGLRPLSQLLHELYPARVVPRNGARNSGGAPADVSVCTIPAARARAGCRRRPESVRGQHLQHRRSLFRLRHDGLCARGEFRPAPLDLRVRRGGFHSPRPIAWLALYENGAAHGLHLRYSGQPRGNRGVFSHRSFFAAAGCLVRRAQLAHRLVRRTAHGSDKGAASHCGGGNRVLSPA